MFLKIALVPILIASQPQFAEETPDSRIEPISENGGTIIIYRPAMVFGAAIACPVRYKGKEIDELGRGKFAEWSVPAGRYILTNKTASVEVAVDPGETRYVRCLLKRGFLTARADFQIVDAESYVKNADDYKRKETVPFFRE